MSEDLGRLATEGRNPATERIDEVSTLEMLRLIHEEDARAVEAVTSELPRIAAVVDAVAERMAGGGRLFYVGAGTSGRLGVLDASECPPTFGVGPELVQGLIAGGDSALRRSSEGSEDSREEGAADLRAIGFAAGDAVVGIAASGRTPYVMGALECARGLGALTVALACVKGSAMEGVAEMAISPETGAEAITGSTRMKAGTATKLVLNMLSTGVMVRRGAVYGNQMVNVQLTNAKLVDRGRRIVAEVVGCDGEMAGRLLAEAGSVKVAIVMGRSGVGLTEAERRVGLSGGRLREALKG